jgi:hypothetical protein
MLLLVFISLTLLQEVSFSQKAVHFQSPGDFIEVPHAPSLAPPEFTIEFWLRIYGVGDTAVAGGEQTIIDKRDGGNGYNFRLAGDTFPLPVFAFVEPGGVAAGDAVYKNLWYHIAVTQSIDSLKIYVNAQLREATANAYASNTNGPLRIGEFLGYPGAYLGLRGDVDELRIWHQVHNQNQIQSLMHEKLTGSETGLSAYWDFDSQTDSVIPDLSPNGNNGTLMGNATLIDSDAPVGFIPPKPPTGLRTYGNNQSIDLAWLPAGDSISEVLLFRGDSADFLMDSSSLLVTLSGMDTAYMDNSVIPDKNYYYRMRVIDQQQHISQPGRSTLSRTLPIAEGYITGVYYYPWYGPAEGGHTWIGQYVRDYLLPKQPPLLGHYSSRDTLVIRQHLDWMETYGIDFMVSSWWGQNSWEDIALRDFILDEIVNTPIKFTIYYESAILGLEQGEIYIDAAAEEQLVSDFNYLAQNYFDHPNFLKIEEKPAVFIYLSGIYSGNYEQAFSRVRSELQTAGYDIFLVGDEVGWGTPDADHMQFLDAVSPYIMLAKPIHKGYPVEKDFFADISVQVGEWEKIAHPQGKVVIPEVNPGFNNRGVGGTGFPKPRQSVPGAESTSTLEEFIKVMRPFVNPQLKMIMITSWNEWHEDTQIEPTIVTNPTTDDISGSDKFYTKGFSYEGDGITPLVVIRNLLASELSVSIHQNHEDIPQTFMLYQNYPNPFNPSTTIEFDLPKTTDVTLKIFNILGEEVATLVSERLNAGSYGYKWDTSKSAGIASGVYLYRLQAGDLVQKNGARRLEQGNRKQLLLIITIDIQLSKNSLIKPKHLKTLKQLTPVSGFR